MTAKRISTLRIDLTAWCKEGYLSRLLQDDQGVTAIEYGLLAALIAVAIIAGAQLLGSNLGSLFTSIAGDL